MSTLLSVLLPSLSLTATNLSGISASRPVIPATGVIFYYDEVLGKILYGRNGHWYDTTTNTQVADFTATALGPTTASFTTDTSSGSLVTSITDLATGETLSSITPNDGRIALSGSSLIVGLTGSTAGTINYTVKTSINRTLTIAVSAVAFTAVNVSLDIANQTFTLNGAATTLDRHIASDSTAARYNFDGSSFTSVAAGALRSSAKGLYGEGAITVLNAYSNDATQSSWNATTGFTKGSTKGAYGPCQRVPVTVNATTAAFNKGITRSVLNNFTAGVPVYITAIYEAGVGGNVNIGIQQAGIVSGGSTYYSPGCINGTVDAPAVNASSDYTVGSGPGTFQNIMTTKLFGNVYQTTCQFVPLLTGAHAMLFGPGSGTVGDSVDFIYMAVTDKRLNSGVIPTTTTTVTSSPDLLKAQNELLSCIQGDKGTLKLKVDLINNLPGNIIEGAAGDNITLLGAGSRNEPYSIITNKTYSPLLPSQTDLATTPTDILITWDTSGGQVQVGTGRPRSFTGTLPSRTAGRILQSAQGRILKIEAANTKTSITDVGPTTNTWKDVKVGAGGYLTGIQFADDGTEIISVDVYGAYLRTSETTPWTNLITQNSLPSGDVNLLKNAGTFGVTICKTNSSRAYMMYLGSIYRSDNIKAISPTWTKTAKSAFSSVEADANQANRIYGRRLECDPKNGDHVIVAMPSGVFRSKDAGATWTQITALGTTASAGTQHLGFSVNFDRSAALVGGCTGICYVSKSGVGVFKTTDGGDTWTQISGTDANSNNLGGPTTHGHAEVGADGTYWLAPRGTSPIAWKYKTNAWTSPSVNSSGNKGPVSICTNPNNAQHIVVTNDVGSKSVSLDNGATWTGYSQNTTRLTRKIPWHKWTFEYYQAIAETAINPVSNLVHMTEGLGIWTTDYTLVKATLPVILTELSDGIEELVANYVLPLASGAYLLCSWDRAFFRMNDLDQYPYHHGINNQKAIVHGWHAAQSPVDQNFIVGIANAISPAIVHQSGYSLDEGRSWTQFATMPPAVGTNNCVGGCIVAGPLGTILWWPAINGIPYKSTDYGATWTAMTFPSLTQTIGSDNGWGNNYVQKRFIAAADPTNIGTVYCYNSKNGLYKSTDWGSTWTLISSSGLATGWTGNTKLKVNPFNGHLYFSAGTGGTSTLTANSTGGTTGNPLKVSTNGGTSFSNIANIAEVWDIEFGAPASGQTTPHLFIVGYLNGTFNHYQSKDLGSTWTALGQFPNGSIDNVAVIGGNRQTYFSGRVLVGRQGSGFATMDAA